MIQIKELSVNYKGNSADTAAIENINMDLKNGEIYTVIGPSGCGKSTLLNVLSGIIRDYQGSVLIDGRPVDPKAQNIGMVFQNYGLLPWKTVYDNASLGLRIKGKGKTDKKSNLGEYTEYIMRQLGIFELGGKYPNMLSGGQKQRVAIARAFIIKPDLLLMDEPFSALDALTREEMQELFLKLWREHKHTTVFVTHSVEEALYLGMKIIVMSGIPGGLYKTIDNDVFGTENFRENDKFHRRASELRKIIEMGWSK